MLKRGNYKEICKVKSIDIFNVFLIQAKETDNKDVRVVDILLDQDLIYSCINMYISWIALVI